MTKLQDALPAFPDAELLMVDLLAPLGVDVGVETPASFVRFVRALRTGGTDDGITDSPILGVTTYAPTRAESQLLTRGVARLIAEAAATEVAGTLIDYTSVYTGPIEQPDQNPDIRAVTTYYVIEYRRPKGP